MIEMFVLVEFDLLSVLVLYSRPPIEISAISFLSRRALNSLFSVCCYTVVFVYPIIDKLIECSISWKELRMRATSWEGSFFLSGS